MSAEVRALCVAAAVGALLASVAGSHASIAKSPARIVYSAGGMIRVVDADGSNSHVLARGEAPSWSPDGTAIAFQSARVPGNGLDIYLMNADGTGQSRLVMHPRGRDDIPINTADDYAPAWGPHGWVIAFTTRRDGNDEIYSMDPIGHRVQQLTNSEAADRDPTWSPDGDDITFVSDRDGNDEIYTLGPRRDLRRLTHAAGADRAPAWSPDGRRIAFQSFRDGNWELYSMNADGSDPRRLTDTPAAETNPAWSRDGRTLVFTAEDAAGRYLATMAATGGPSRRVTAPGLSADHADWRPAADLVLAVRHPRTARRGKLLRVRLAVRNVIRAPAHYVVVTTSVPPGTRVMNGRVGSGECSRSRPGTLRCSIRYVGPSNTVFVNVTLRVQRCGRIAIRSSVASVQGDLTPGNNERRATVPVDC